MSEGIVLSPLSSSLETRVGFHFYDTFGCVKNVIDTGSRCTFDLLNCVPAIPQFIDLNDLTDKYKNDWTDFIFDLASGYTIEVDLVRCSDDTNYTINDNTYGFLTDLGGFPDRPRVWAFVVSWQKVYNELGFGRYKFEFTFKNGAGTVVEEKTSACFHLKQWSCEQAHGTVRIETLQNGYIFNGFDYRSLFATVNIYDAFQSLTKGWKSQLRVYGRMWPDVPDEENDFIQMSDRKNSQIQQKVTEKHKLMLRHITSDVGKQLIRDRFMANQILISDYNMNAYEFYRDKEVLRLTTDEIDTKKLKQTGNLYFTFKDVDEGTVKRSYD